MSSRRPAEGYVLEYLVGCYQRLEKSGCHDRIALELRHLVVSYVGLTLLLPSMVPQPPRCDAHGSL